MQQVGCRVHELMVSSAANCVARPSVINTPPRFTHCLILSAPLILVKIELNIETQSLQVEPDATYNGVISMTQRLAHTIPVLPYATENMLDDEEAAS